MTEVQQNVDHSSVYNTPPLDAQCRQLSMETAVNYNRSKTPDDSPNLDLRKEQELSPASSQGHRELPPHWERVQSEQHGRYYYWNRVTDKTTWKFPEEDGEIISLSVCHGYLLINNSIDHIKVTSKNSHSMTAVCM